MLRTLFSALLLLTCTAGLTAPQVWAADTSAAKQEKKKLSTKE